MHERHRSEQVCEPDRSCSRRDLGVARPLRGEHRGLGPGFDPDTLEFPPPFTDPERLNFERGLGIPLIKTLVDNAAFVRKEKGTSVRVTVFGGPSDGDDTGAIYMDVSKLSSLMPPPKQDD